MLNEVWFEGFMGKLAIKKYDGRAFTDKLQSFASSGSVLFVVASVTSSSPSVTLAQVPAKYTVSFAFHQSDVPELEASEHTFTDTSLKTVINNLQYLLHISRCACRCL